MFTFKESLHGYPMLCTKAKFGADIEILFINSDPVEVYIDGDDHRVIDDTLNDMGFNVAGEWYSVTALVIKATEEYDDIIADAEQEAIDNANMEREWSSPYLSGRI